MGPFVLSDYMVRRHLLAKRRPHRKGRLGSPPAAFGQQVTADHIVTQDEWDIGVTGERTALVTYDRATGWLDISPLHTKNADDAYHALQHFAGPSCPKAYVYSDGS